MKCRFDLLAVLRRVVFVCEPVSTPRFSYVGCIAVAVIKRYTISLTRVVRVWSFVDLAVSMARLFSCGDMKMVDNIRHEVIFEAVKFDKLCGPESFGDFIEQDL